MDMQTTNNTTSSTILGYEYFIASVLIMEFAMTIFSNVMLLLLIARSHKSPITLNIFLMSLSILDLLLSINQLISLALIFKTDRSLPHQICHISFGIQEIGVYGIVLLHLVISYNRYRTSKNPIHWESNLKKAWVTTGIIWILMILLATLESILHIGGIRGNIETCFWPRVDEHIPFKFSFQISIFVVLLITIVVTCYYHKKTINLLNENRKTLEKDTEMTSEIQYYEGGSSSPEKTARSLVVVFAIHVSTLLFPFFYETIRIPIITVIWGVTGNTEDPTPTPLLLFVTTVGLFTAVSPFFFIVVSQRFKANVASLFLCKWKQVAYQQYVASTKEIMTTRIHGVGQAEPPPSSAVDLSIFLGEATVKDKYKHTTTVKRMARLAERGEDTIALTENAYTLSALGSPEDEEAGGRSGHDRSDVPTPRQSCTSEIRQAAEQEAAVESGLVLATASHNQALREFFEEEDEVERQYREALAAKALDDIFLT